MSSTKVFRILPQTYLHVLDTITNVTRVESGPQTLICQRHEEVSLKPRAMITIPPRHYVIIANPVRMNGDKVVTDKFGQAVLKWGEKEVRTQATHPDPFPLYPSEEVAVRLTKLQMVYKNSALHLLCLQDFTTDAGIARKVGDQYLFEGPNQYIPNTNEHVVKKIEAIVIKRDQALRLRALDNCLDRDGKKRIAGEEWLVRRVGAYLPGVYEKKIAVIKAEILTDKRAIHVRAVRTFVDQTGVNRLCGDEWLVTNQQTEAYIPSVSEEIIRSVKITTLTSRQYVVIVNPMSSDDSSAAAGGAAAADAGGDDEKKESTSAKRTNLWGHQKLVTGPVSLFLHPGENLARGIENVYVLTEEQGLVLSCLEKFTDTINGKKIERNPGDRWMITGPMEFICPVGAKVLRVNKAISLGENEGVYVRNFTTGVIRAVIGQTYLLKENEEKWQKKLPADLEELLATEKGYYTKELTSDASFIRKLNAKISQRDKTRVIAYDVPHNHVLQIWDFCQHKGRCVVGPALVLLEPGELITSLTFSGGKPKKFNRVKCLHLRMGPEFSSDQIFVETSDHCKLKIDLSYNWLFDVPDRDGKAKASVAAAVVSTSEDGVPVPVEIDEEDDEKKESIGVRNVTGIESIFAVNDFVGDMCKNLSSKIRSAVSKVPFDSFHKTSADLIQKTIFGETEDGKPGDSYRFPSNNLVVTGIDIKSIEPVDPKTQRALQKSVQLAIEITAKAQEANARHSQKLLEQSAKGKLEKQKLHDKAQAEIANKKFMEAQVETRAVRNIGKARAEAESKAEMLKIAAEAAVEEARLAAEAAQIEMDSEIEELESRQASELTFLRQKNKLEVERAEKLAAIEVKRLTETSSAIGAKGLKAIALAGPQLQARLLKGLKLEPDFLTGGGLPFVTDE